jgi:hypothetical protein
MASERQRAAARRNVKKAQAGAKRKAARLEINGRSKMDKDELRAAIARAK